MHSIRKFQDRAMRAFLDGSTRARLARESERGDVPGWVLITLMTAGLVTLLWSVAGKELTSMFTNAIHGVNGGK